ncbi:MAG: A/G-specific adenine glycosylase [Gammaproteobacteria bacterium]|nr:A/G-specific adenine glycosylase [Gammaproteobacteria bacterium]
MHKQFSRQLLTWFDQHGRKDLPWQQDKTPYRVWISEIMLQQTQVKTVIPYYLRFTQRFPDISTLAQAPQDDVLHLWTGLGYYARARNLHKAARIIHNDYQGQFPCSHEVLQSLPGIGRSTAGAILSFAHGQHHPILDGNVKRILSRHNRIDGWSGHTKTQKSLWSLAEKITPKTRCDDFNQALMDLGSSLCSRSKPQCEQCPLANTCEAYLNEMTDYYPRPKPKKDKPEKSAYLLMLSTGEDELLLEKRPAQGIWGSLWSFPQCNKLYEIEQWLAEHHYVISGEMQFSPKFRHTFSHFHLQITPVQILVEKSPRIMDDNRFLWFNLQKPLKLGMPAPITRLISQWAAKPNSTKKE